MNIKKQKRLRRALRVRSEIKRLGAIRLTVHRTINNMYAQLISSCGSKVLAQASTTEAEIKQKIKNGGNKTAAALVGKTIAERAKKAGVTRVAFDRSGFKYHGRVQALADAAREGGIEF